MRNFSLAFKRAEAPLPTPTIPLSQEDLHFVNSAMNGHSQAKNWRTLLQNNDLIPIVLHDALFCASTALQSTSFRSRVVAPRAIPPAGVLGEELSNDTMAELKIMLQGASKHGKWDDIIMHRLFLFLLFSF
jgi:hypothetical protein